MKSIISYFKLIEQKVTKNFRTINKSGIYYVNWIGENWIEQFLQYNFPDKQKYNLCLCSIDGKPKNLQSIKVPKIFFSGENLESFVEHNNCKKSIDNDIYKWLVNREKYYGDYRLNEVDLSLGFAKKDDNKYLRFPLWLMYVFPPNIKYREIKNIVNDINTIKSNNIDEAVCINSHDVFGVRELIRNTLSNNLTITYAGKWRNNTKELWKTYQNNKLSYMKNFKFNICPENMDAADYCTEKLFDSLRCGCIPIYAGSLNNPEPEIINHDFVIFWDLDGDNYEQIKLVDRLNKDDNYYQRFISQPKLKADAADHIAEYFEQLKLKIKELI